MKSLLFCLFPSGPKPQPSSNISPPTTQPHPRDNTWLELSTISIILKQSWILILVEHFNIISLTRTEGAGSPQKINALTKAGWRQVCLYNDDMTSSISTPQTKRLKSLTMNYESREWIKRQISVNPDASIWRQGQVEGFRVFTRWQMTDVTFILLITLI